MLLLNRISGSDDIFKFQVNSNKIFDNKKNRINFLLFRYNKYDNTKNSIIFEIIFL